jgi:hypothetical protein
MNKLILILLLAVCAQADAGNCEYPEGRASDGSRCGKRSSYDQGR